MAGLVGASSVALQTLSKPRAVEITQLAAPNWTAPTIPDTPPGARLAGFLEAFNSGDEEKLKQFIADYFTPVGPGGADLPSRMGAQLRLYKSSRGLNLYQIEESTEAAIAILAQFRLTQEWRRMTFMIEPASPHRISGIKIVPIDPPAIADASPLTDQQLRQ